MAVKTEVDTFHCSPNTNVAVIKGKTLPIYVCRHGDVSFVLAAEGHAQPHLDLSLDRETVQSLSDVYVKRTVKRQKRQFGGFGSGFSNANANANAGSFGGGGGGGFGGTPFSGFPLGGGGGGFGGSQSGASAFSNSAGGGFGYGR